MARKKIVFFFLSCMLWISREEKIGASSCWCTQMWLMVKNSCHIPGWRRDREKGGKKLHWKCFLLTLHYYLGLLPGFCPIPGDHNLGSIYDQRYPEIFVFTPPDLLAMVISDLLYSVWCKMRPHIPLLKSFCFNFSLSHINHNIDIGDMATANVSHFTSANNFFPLKVKFQGNILEHANWLLHATIRCFVQTTQRNFQ